MTNYIDLYREIGVDASLLRDRFTKNSVRELTPPISDWNDVLQIMTTAFSADKDETGIRKQELILLLLMLEGAGVYEISVSSIDYEKTKVQLSNLRKGLAPDYDIELAVRGVRGKSASKYRIVRSSS